MKDNNKGCGISLIVLVLLLFFLCIRVFINKTINENTTCVNVISSDRSISKIRLNDSIFSGRDTSFIGSSYVYQNQTGRDLVNYMVGYSSSDKNSFISVGKIIHSGEYFLWFDNDESFKMFCPPPSSTTIVTRRTKIEFTYLHFLDYAENVPDYVILNKDNIQY